jgi:hypothetical protein
MRKFILLCSLLFSAAFAQAQTQALWGYDWSRLSTTGQDGPYLNLFFEGNLPPVAYDISWTVSGTAPSVCTFRIEGSDDATNWTGLDATAPAVDSETCTTSNIQFVVNKPTRYIRVNIVTYTAGDSTTSVIFHYTRGL